MPEYYRRILKAEIDKNIWFLHRSIEMALQINAEPIPIEMHRGWSEHSEFNRVSTLETATEGGSLSQFYHYGHATVQLTTFSEGTRHKNRGSVEIQFISSVKASLPTDRLVDQYTKVFPQLQELAPWRPVHLRTIQEDP